MKKIKSKKRKSRSKKKSQKKINISNRKKIQIELNKNSYPNDPVKLEDNSLHKESSSSIKDRLKHIISKDRESLTA